MDRVARCLNCETNLVPITALSGHTELRCVFCERLEPMETWAEDDAVRSSPRLHKAADCCSLKAPQMGLQEPETS
jgi:hypothetical protein